MPSLFVIHGIDQGTRFEFKERVVSVGRDASSVVQLHDTEVSRQHADLFFAEGVYTVTDLNSSNGTFVNGKRVSEQRLSSGDQVQVGATVMLYTQPTDESSKELAARVNISADKRQLDESHIVSTMTHEESSRIFHLEEESRQNPWLAQAHGNLQVMYRTALAVSHTLDIDQLLHRIMELIFEWVETDRGCIMLVSPETKSLELKVFRSRLSTEPEEKITISKTILDYVMEHNEGVLTSDARQDDRWNPAASILKAGVCEAICVPMQGRYDVVGVIYIDTSTTPQDMVRMGQANRFSEEHLKLMVAIAHQAALAVEDTRYYSAMVQAERLAAVGQTMATLSHHIKNILQGIRGGSYLIEMGLADHDEEIVGKGWKIVEKNQKKISSLVLDMLTFSKEREPDLAPADMNNVLAEVVELMQSRADDLGVRLVCRPAEQMPILVFDAEGMHRAVLNVLTNALDAAAQNDDGGQVEIATQFSPEDHKVRVLVSDNGPGIPPEERENLFRPFVSSKKGRGTGLGLPVSQKIINEHGGRILVDSIPGQGSRFTLELPAVTSDSDRQTLPG